MGRGLILLNDGERDYYLEWSTIVGAPVTYGMNEKELYEHIRYRYGQEGIDEMPERIKRLAETGTSFECSTLDSVIFLNRAGEDETQLTKEQIIEAYCHRKPRMKGTYR